MPYHSLRRAGAAMLLLLIVACGQQRAAPPPTLAITPSPAPATPAPPSQVKVQLYFHHSEDDMLADPRPVERTIDVRQPEDPADLLHATLAALVAGPTPEERREGYVSVFDAETAGSVLSVHVTDAGHAVINFKNFAALMPNVSTSAGSRGLTFPLSMTIFQFESIQTIEYQFEGSCEEFWGWLQSYCHHKQR